MYLMYVNGKEKNWLDIDSINGMDMEGEVWNLKTEDNYVSFVGNSEEGDVKFVHFSAIKDGDKRVKEIRGF